jgi:hypothetical protein
MKLSLTAVIFNSIRRIVCQPTVINFNDYHLCILLSNEPILSKIGFENNRRDLRF